MSETANGTYIVEYTVTISGLYEIKVSLGEQPIKGSPFAMQALPADARASHSVAFGRNGSMQVATAGELNEFYILAKDTYGNQEHASAEHVGNFRLGLGLGLGSLREPVAGLLVDGDLKEVPPRALDTSRPEHGACREEEGLVAARP